MGFDAEERASLLALKGVGATVIDRLQQMGFSCLADVAGSDPQAINQTVAHMLHATCWANSPLAKMPSAPQWSWPTHGRPHSPAARSFPVHGRPTAVGL